MALHFLDYILVGIHRTLETTLAMAAGVTDRLWEVADMVNVLEAREASSQGRFAALTALISAFIHYN
jgi:hypothetical protein